MKLDFLSSRRFWSLVLIAIVGVLKSENVITPDLAQAVIIILGGFIGIRTIDKFADGLK